MDRIEIVKNKFGSDYKIFVIECKRLDIKKLDDNDIVVKGDGISYVFLLKPIKNT